MPATGLARSRGTTLADPHLAFEAVRIALERLGTDRAQSVLLFLTGHYARDPSTAITCAASCWFESASTVTVASATPLPLRATHEG